MSGLEVKFRMDKRIIYKDISLIDDIPTSHSIGLKKVIIKNESRSKLEQVALGFFKAGENVEKHSHVSMEEFYFFQTGRSIFI